jgi:hypothetical protein
MKPEQMAIEEYQKPQRKWDDPQQSRQFCYWINP